MKSIINEFKEFISRGNMVDLAVAVVVGAAFTQVVNAFAKSVILQLVAAIFGTPNFDTISQRVNGTQVYWGTLLTALVNFFIVAVAVFLVIKGLNAMSSFRRRGEREEAEELTEIELLTQIRDALVTEET